MKREALTMIAVLALTASSSAPALDRPDTVSPGGLDQFGRIDATRPTFSWSAVAGAELYELIVFALDDVTGADAEVSEADEAHPVLRQSVPGGALSWTPSLGAPLVAPGRYGWSMRARIEGAALTDWSPPRLFEVLPLAQRLELEGVSWPDPLEGPRRDEAPEVRMANTDGGTSLDERGKVRGRAASLTGSAALRADQPDLVGGTFGVVGTASSPDGVGVAAGNSGGGTDLLLDGSADTATDTLLTQAGIDRPSTSAESFQIVNSGGGDMTLVTEQLESSGATDLATGGALTTVHGSLSVLGDASISGKVDGVDVSAHAVATTGVHGVGAGDIVGTTLAQTLTNKTLTAPTIGDFTSAAHDHANIAGGGVLDHGALTGLNDDDHTQYARLGGRPGGQILWGGMLAGNHLSMDSTTSSTKGEVRVVNGSSFSVYSDGGGSLVFYVSGTSGSVYTSGTVDGIDVATHNHSTGTGQTRLAARDRRRIEVWHKDDADTSPGDVTSERVVFTAPENVTVTDIFVSPASGLTANNIDFATLIVHRRDAGGGSQVTVAAADTQTGGSGGTGSWTAFSTVSLGSLSNTSIPAGSKLTLEIAKAGTGVVLPVLALQIEFTVD